MKSIYLFICLIFISTSVTAQETGLNFDGVNDRILTTAPSITGTNARTIEAWIKTTKNSLPANQGGLGQSVILDMGIFANSQRFTFNLLFNNSIRLEVGGNGLSATTPVNDGNWHHVAVTYDGAIATNQVKLYVDGVLDVQGNLTVPINTASGTILIGERKDGVNRFEGSMDEVRVYNFAKTQGQIAADRNTEFCGTYPSGLVSYFKLNEGTPNMMNAGATLATEYISGNNGTLNNFALSGTTSNWSDGAILAGGPTSGTLNDSGCSPYSTPAGNSYTASGSYVDTLINSLGCDSFLILNLTINSGSTTNLDTTVCNGTSIVVNGTTYNAANPSGTENFPIAGSCDSVVTVTLIELPPLTGIFDTTICNGASFDYNGTTYDASNLTGTEVFTTSSGCDSTINISVTILSPITGTFDTTICSASSFVYNGTTYDASNLTGTEIFTTSLGCDSVVTVNVTLSPTLNFTDAYSACENFTWIDGVTYTSSNNTATFSNGCDSIVTLDLTIYNAVTTNESVSACDIIAIDGTSYTSSQIINLTYATTNGCDSIHSIDLTIDSVDASVTVALLTSSGAILTANEIGASYQWIDCSDSSVLVGETAASFSPMESGAYAVIISKNTCTAYSACEDIIITGIKDVYLGKSEIVPNPSNGNFSISLDKNIVIKKLQIMDVLGQIITERTINRTEDVQVSEDLNSGIYFFRLETSQGILMSSFTVK